MHSLCPVSWSCTEKGRSHLVNTSLAKLQLRKWRKTFIQSQIKVQKCEGCFQHNNQGKNLQKHWLCPLMLQWKNIMPEKNSCKCLQKCCTLENWKPQIAGFPPIKRNYLSTESCKFLFSGKHSEFSPKKCIHIYIYHRIFNVVMTNYLW